VPLLPRAKKNSTYWPKRRLVKLEQQLAEVDTKCICATDGSFDAGAAGWGVLIEHCQDVIETKYSNMVYGADQSCLAAETEAVEYVLRANCVARVPELVFLIDNQTVQVGLSLIAKGSIYMPKYSFGRWESMMEMISNQQVESYWIPSHGKKHGWAPPVTCYGDVTKWRRRNAQADAMADLGRKMAGNELDLRRRAVVRMKAASAARAAMTRMIIGSGGYILANGLGGKWSKAFEGVL